MKELACTAEKIILAAEELMLSKGFHEVGLNEILRAVNVPKGSFYHHFASKEDFGVKMVSHYIKEHSIEREKGFNDPTNGETAIERIFGFWEEKLSIFIDNGCECPCLLLKLTAEVSESSEPMRCAIAEGVKTWLALYEKILTQAVREGLLKQDIDIRGESLFLLNYWEGAVHMAVTTRDPEPCIVALKQLRHHFTYHLAL